MQERVEEGEMIWVNGINMLMMNTEIKTRSCNVAVSDEQEREGETEYVTKSYVGHKIKRGKMQKYSLRPAVQSFINAQSHIIFCN